MQRIVTGLDAAGRSVIIGDAPPAEHNAFGTMLRDLWVTSCVPANPTEGGEPPVSLEPEPPPGGVLFRLVTLLPDDEMLTEQIGSVKPQPDPEQVGMHRTDTVDFVTVLSGEIWLRLDGGEEVHLDTGDCVIQRGTMHAWQNTSGAPCVLSAVLASARPQQEL